MSAAVVKGWEEGKGKRFEVCIGNFVALSVGLRMSFIFNGVRCPTCCRDEFG